MAGVRESESWSHPTDVQLAPERAPARRTIRSRRGARPSLAGWLMPPVMLASTACGIALVLRGPERAFVVSATIALALVVVWILVSVFFPARVDRTCPECGEESLRRLDSRTTRGILCARCGLVDEQQSSFLLAEEEGPLERIVLAERAVQRTGGAGSVRDVRGASEQEKSEWR
jgi:hypothetical protein